METPLRSEIETKISIGDAIEIHQRVIYPVARVSVLKRRGDLLGCWIAQVALLITEQDNAYVISLTKEEITLDQLLERAPSLNVIAGGPMVL
jgi:uncharacterized spore protein YtfJ